MKKSLTLFVMAVSCFSLLAQDKTVTDLKKESEKEIKKDPNDTIPKMWKTGGLVNVVFGQTSLSNWAAGGDQFQLNANGLLSLYAFYKNGRHAWDNTLDLALGFVNTTSLGTRKSDDKMDLTSKYGYRLSETSKWYASLLFNFRSQFAPGYEYPNDSTINKISDFMSPAYALLSAGFNYKPSDNFYFFISPISSRWVIVTATGLNPKTPNDKGNVFGVPLGQTVNNEIGAYLSTAYMKEFVKNVIYKGKLDLFSNYKHNPQNVDVYWTNLLTANVFKGFTFSVGLDLIYDDDVKAFGPNRDSPRTQFREYIGFGYSKKF